MANLLKSILNPDIQAQNGTTAPQAEDPSLDLPSEAHSKVSPALIVLGKTLYFKGELSAEEDLILLGHLEGPITHSQSFIVGPGATVIGDIHARVVHVKGTVKGDITATESVVIDPGATVTGDIVAPSVSVIEGATFNGAVRMHSTQQTQTLKQRLDDAFEGEYVVTGRALDRQLEAREDMRRAPVASDARGGQSVRGREDGSGRERAPLRASGGG